MGQARQEDVSTESGSDSVSISAASRLLESYPVATALGTESITQVTL